MSKLIFRLHALQRMFLRDISENQVRHVVDNGKIIENYENDRPYPSRLISGSFGSRNLHVVAAINDEAHEIIVVTVYEPDPHLWENDFTNRRKK